MYRGFNLSINKEIEDKYLTLGKQRFEEMNEQVKLSLNNYLLPNKSLNGDKLINDWFPELNTNIFLSHSHKDKELALKIAGILYEKFKIITFIDSTVWGYANDLLKKIDDEYCRNDDDTMYDYNKRNYSTSHIHLMLMVSLNKMINKSEAIIFLNTPNSISVSNEITNKTNSPWIFSEIATTKIIQKETPHRLKRYTKLFSATETKSLNENLMIEYDLELSHLTELNFEDFEKWIKNSSIMPETGLDLLYQLKPLKSKFLV